MSKYKKYYSNNGEKISIDSLLPENESILWRGKPKKFAMIVNTLLSPMTILGICWSSFALYALLGCIIAEMHFFIIVYLMFFLAIPITTCLSEFFGTIQSLKNIEYVVTDRRILIKTGFFGIDLQSIFYKEIKSVSLNKGIIDNILGVADIYIETQNSNPIFFDLENSYEIYNRLQKIVLDIQSDIEFPNAYRPDSNPGYNTKYEEK